MSFSWNHALLDQLGFAWDAQFRPRLQGLADAECLWEPVAGCWMVRPDPQGHWRQDLADREPDPPPFIFGDGSFDPVAVTWTGSADDALAFVTAEYTRWREGVRSLGEEGFFRPCGPAEGPYADEPFLMLVLHINREFLHHAAEVMLLRDLYRDAGA